MTTDLLPTTTVQPLRWVRSPDGLVAGVCEGLSRRLDMDPWVIRFLWLGTVLFFGTGLLLYAILAVALPREDRLADASKKRILGVSARIAAVTGLEIGVVRVLAILLALASFGATIVGYVVLHFVLDDGQGTRSAGSHGVQLA
jgi:phage shock protein PspC (stress-responsive transcriptional regulator)